MKMDHIAVGPGCSVGTDSVVLYSSRMEARSVLGDLSLLMKGESLPEGTRWEGSPARPSRPTTWPGEPHAEGPNRPDVRLFLGPEAQPLGVPRELQDEVFRLDPDGHGRPRAVDRTGQTLAISSSRADGARLLALAREGRIGVDLEPLQPSGALEAAAELLLPSERRWADGFSTAQRWQAHLRLWTAKEAVLKALGRGFAHGLDEVELGPDGRGGIRLQRLFGSTRLAEGWHLELQESALGERTFLLAVAVIKPG